MAALRSTLQLSQKVCALGLFNLQQHARGWPHNHLKMLSKRHVALKMVKTFHDQ